MAMTTYRYTGGQYADLANGRKHRDWAAAWTELIGVAVGGMDVLERHEVYRIMHEIRRRVEAGDYGPPLAFPAQHPHPQEDLGLRR